MLVQAYNRRGHYPVVKTPISSKEGKSSYHSYDIGKHGDTSNDQAGKISNRSVIPDWRTHHLLKEFLRSYVRQLPL
jgi:hypothetical protein